MASTLKFLGLKEAYILYGYTRDGAGSIPVLITTTNTNIMTPIEITQDSDNGMNFASFTIDEGKNYAQTVNKTRCTNIMQVDVTSEYWVSLGHVVMMVEPSDFPDIERRII